MAGGEPFTSTAAASNTVIAIAIALWPSRLPRSPDNASPHSSRGRTSV